MYNISTLVIQQQLYVCAYACVNSCMLVTSAISHNYKSNKIKLKDVSKYLSINTRQHYT